MDIKREIGSKIKRIRHKKGITQEKLAEQVEKLERENDYLTTQLVQNFFYFSFLRKNINAKLKIPKKSIL